MECLLFDLFELTPSSLQAGDWTRAQGSRGHQLGGAEAGARAGLQHSLASVPFCKTHKGALDSFADKVAEAGQFLGAGDVGQEIGFSGSSLKVS